jgi:hypothetical protein
MKRGACVFVGAFAAVLMLAPDRGAAEEGMGLSGIHQWVRVGRKTCMLDHFHDGSGIGATKAQAQASAIRAWSDFTAWEYGDRWGKWQLAESKSGGCTGSGKNFSCNVSARPCRL